MEWLPIWIVVAWMALLLIPACTVRDPHPRLMLLFGIFFVLSFGGMVEGVLWLVGEETLRVVNPGPAPDLRSP